jgi:hypothetical protein
MEAQTPSKKDEDEEVVGTSEPTSRSSIDSTVTNTSNFVAQSPSIANTTTDYFTPTRHSIEDIRDIQNLSRQALSRRLSTLSTSSYGDLGDTNLNWNPREAGINGFHCQSDHANISHFQCSQQHAITGRKATSIETYHPRDSFSHSH